MLFFKVWQKTVQAKTGRSYKICIKDEQIECIEINQMTLLSSKAMVPNIFGIRDRFVEDNFPQIRGGEYGLGMIQVHYIYCALYF